MANKKLGVLGGMGPMATVDFLRKLTNLTPSTNDQGHVPLIIHTYPQTPDRTMALTSNGPSPLPYLIDGAKSIEQAGASALVMPCNTAHAWYPEVQATVSIPVLHIADAALNEVERLGALTRIGLLSTAGTIKSGVYTKYRDDVQWVVPSDELMDVSVMPAIRLVKANDFSTARQRLLPSLTWIQEQRVEAVILGCTELPLIADTFNESIALVDATQALAKQALHWWLQT